MRRTDGTFLFLGREKYMLSICWRGFYHVAGWSMYIFFDRGFNVLNCEVLSIIVDTQHSTRGTAAPPASLGFLVMLLNG